MKIFKFSMLFILSILMLYSCTIEETPTTGTRLKVYVNDGNTNLVSGVSVGLYGTSNDCSSKTNVIVSKTTNSEGFVVFGDLEPGQSYYPYAVKDSQNSRYCIGSRKMQEDEEEEVVLSLY